MDPDDLARFRANYEWFTAFFDGLRQFFSLVIQALPEGFLPSDFAERWGNYYFPRQNFAPTMPDHYALMLRGRQAALQVIAVLDSRHFAGLSRFTPEPSIVAVLHGDPERACWIQDYGLRVVSGSGVHFDPEPPAGSLSGTIRTTPPTRFVARQITFDRLASPEAVRQAIEQDVVGLVTQGLPAS